MNVIKSLIIAAALVTGGSAFANDGSDSLSQAITESRVAFSSKATNQATSPRGVISSIPFTQNGAGVTNSTAFPVNTMNLSNGTTK